MTSKLNIRAEHYSIAGVKPHNEDACGVYVPKDTLLNSKGIAIVLADGMSGCEAGAEASKACVGGFFNDYFSTPETWSTKSSVQKVLSALNRWMHGQGQREYGSAKGMVSTLSAIVLKSNTAYLFHIGDTRIYRLRQGDLEPLTRDHRTHVSKDKSYLTRAMGIELHVDIDYRAEPVEVGDIFLLVTDGVYEFITDAAMRAQLLANMAAPEVASRQIVEQALANGSNDNLSCQIIQVTHLPDQDEGEFYRQLTELPFPPPLEAGMILDGYHILRQLFANRRSEVYLAEDTDGGNYVVLKAPSVNYADDPDYINQFLHEEWAGRRIDNPHVLKVLEPHRQRQCLYYVTEYIEGQSLRQWINDNPRPSLTRVRGIIEQIAAGLRALHRMEMIHQDLKPENILIDRHGTLRIIDFGSAKIAGIEEISTPLDNDNLLGTVAYTAPEYHRNEPITHRSDIFSLGIICYELLTGKKPYGKALEKRNTHHLHYIPAKHYCPEIPLWVDKALEKAVHPEPRWRYGELSEFIQDLSRANQSLLTGQQAPLIEQHPVSFWRSLSLILFVINLVLLYRLSG